MADRWLLHGRVPRPCPAVITDGGTQPDWPSLRLLRPPKLQGQVLETTYIPGRGPLPLGLRGRDGEKVPCHLKGWTQAVGGPDEGSGALQDTAPSLCPPAHPAYLPAQGGKAWRGLGRRPPLTPYHTLLWEDHNTANHWPRATSTHQVKGFLLMVAW